MLTPEQAEACTILKILAGSHVHGLNVEPVPCPGCKDSPVAGTVWLKQSIDDGMGTETECPSCKGTGYSIRGSDRDEEAIIIEPLAEAINLGQPFEEVVREGRGDGPDCKWVSLRKWCRLACKGNPNFLLALFAPLSHVLKMDGLGSQLREMRSAFISKQAIRSHLGYMKGQRSRLVNHQDAFMSGDVSPKGSHGKPRFDLIEKYGYDTKFAMHLIRLGMQGCELARTGSLTLPMRDEERNYLLDVRAGKSSFEDVMITAQALEAEMKDLFDGSKLPDEPNYAVIEEWMAKVYIRTWYAQRRLQDLIEDTEIFHRTH